jgi:hypothetical protein
MERLLAGRKNTLHTAEPTMRFVELFQNFRPMGRYDVPDQVDADQRQSFRLFGATRMGGNGVVFEASELIDGRPTGKTYAVKVLKQLNPARVDRFNNEVRVLRELSSPYISAYTASGQERLHSP